MEKRKLGIILRIFFSIFLLLLLLWLARNNFAKISFLLTSASIPVFLLAFLIYLLSVPAVAWRLKIALSAQNISIATKDLVGLTLIGNFFTNFLPTTVGGDIIKGYFISQKAKSKAPAYASVIFDRIVGVFSLSIIACCVLLVAKKEIKDPFVFLIVGLLFILCAIFSLFLFNKNLLRKVSSSLRLGRLLRFFKINSFAEKGYNAVSAYKNFKCKMLQMFVFSLAAQLISLSSVYFLAICLYVNLPFAKVLLFMPIIISLAMIPITMNGLGLREWAFVFFFSPAIGQAAALSLSLLFLAVFLLSSLIGGVIYLFWK